MISKLPKWIEYGAFIMAFVAGCINVIGLLGGHHQAVSHVTGTASQLASTIYQFSFLNVLNLVGVLAAFIFGAAISSFLIGGTTVRLTRHYDTSLMLEALLIFAAFLLLSEGAFSGYFALSMACGIQNAFATTYSGAIVRTTHLTGIFTDLGIMMGSILRGEPFDKRKAILFLLITVGFISGGVFGAFLFDSLAYKALLAPAFMCVSLAVSYRFYKKTKIG